MKPIVILIAGALIFYAGVTGIAEQLYRVLANKK